VRNAKEGRLSRRPAAVAAIRFHRRAGWNPTNGPTLLHLSDRSTGYSVCRKHLPAPQARLRCGIAFQSCAGGIAGAERLAVSGNFFRQMLYLCRVRGRAPGKAPLLGVFERPTVLRPRALEMCIQVRSATREAGLVEQRCPIIGKHALAIALGTLPRDARKCCEGSQQSEGLRLHLPYHQATPQARMSPHDPQNALALSSLDHSSKRPGSDPVVLSCGNPQARTDVQSLARSSAVAVTP
jgi:hypothetical protein